MGLQMPSLNWNPLELATPRGSTGFSVVSGILTASEGFGSRRWKMRDRLWSFKAARVFS